jgi:hypothetical protein
MLTPCSTVEYYPNILVSAVCYYSLEPRAPPAFTRLASTMIRGSERPHMVGRGTVSALLSAGAQQSTRSTNDQESKLCACVPGAADHGGVLLDRAQ